MIPCSIIGLTPRLASLLGHGQVARPRRDDDHPPHLGARGLRAFDPERAADRVVPALRKRRPELARGRRLDPRHEPALPMRDQGPQNGLDLLCRLALAEDHLGKPAANPAVEIDLGKSPGIDVRLGADSQYGVGRGERTGRNGIEQVCQLIWIHEPRHPPEGLSPRDRAACLRRFLL